MRSPWSPLMKSSIAATAISQTHVAAAAPKSEPGRAVLISDIVTLATPTADTWLQLNSWLGDSYTRAPALMVVLAALIALPPLAFAGFILRRQSRRSPDVTVRIRANRSAPRARHGTLPYALNYRPGRPKRGSRSAGIAMSSAAPCCASAARPTTTFA